MLLVVVILCIVVGVDLGVDGWIFVDYFGLCIVENFVLYVFLWNGILVLRFNVFGYFGEVCG